MSASVKKLPQEAAPRGLPVHVAIIMDGNGRWAKMRGLPRVAGHRAGSKAVHRVVDAALSQGIQWLTLYAFSSENWSRPPDEVIALTGLLRHYLRTEVATLCKKGVRLRIIGERHRFDAKMQAEIASAEQVTSANRGLTLVIALSYGGRSDILTAARAMAEAAVAGRVNPAAMDEAAFCRLLMTDGIPDPDLLLRTSGEQRLSNFLLWQCAYSELTFTDVLWPDFREEHLLLALRDYSTRERRFGGRLS